MTEDNVGFNSAYVSLNLLDELDYVIGGYGKPKIEFLFSLNTFVESFIASSNFYTSLDELNHLNLTAPAIFPNGRPILNMLVKAGGLKFVNGVIDKPNTEIYRGDMYDKTRKEAQQEFIISYGQSLGTKYFLYSDIKHQVDDIPLITSKIVDDEFIVSEVLTQPAELVSNLLGVSRSSSIQTTLPLFIYEKQISSLFKTPYLSKSLSKIASIHEENLEEFLKTLNFDYLPVPPFTSILLDQVSSVSELSHKLMQLRLDFQQLREKFVDLEREIYESKKLKDQVNAYDKFQEFWKTFMKKYSKKRHRVTYNFMDISKGADFDKGIDKFLDGEGVLDALKDLNLGKLGGNILSTVIEKYQDSRILKRYKGLTNIWELFQAGSGIEEQLRHVERLFGVQFSNSEINEVNRFIRTRIPSLPSNLGQ